MDFRGGGWSGLKLLGAGLTFGVLISATPGSAQTSSPGQDEPATTKKENLTPAQRALNVDPTQRFRLTVPVFYDQTPIASMEAEVATSGEFEAAREDVLAVLSNVLNESALAEVEQSLAGVEVVTPIEAEQAGFQMVFDPQSVGLRLTTARDARQDTDLRLNEPRDTSAIFDNSPEPATVSAFVNLTAGAIIDGGDDTEVGALLGGTGALRLFDLVFRGSTLYDTTDDEFEFGSAQMIYDIIDHDIRMTAGDINTIGGDLIGTEDVIGMSLSHQSGRFGRPRALSPLTAETFDLDRSATVEIYVNGVLRRRFRLAPGRYSLSDFDLNTGANEIQIITIDDAGNRDEINLTSFGGAAVLSPGELKWEISAGFVTEEDLVDFDFDFEDEKAVGAARVIYGVTPGLSVGLAGIVREEGQAASISFDTALPIGLVALDLAGSNSDGELGGAANLTFTPFLPEFLEYPGRGLSFSAFAASRTFSNVALPDVDNEQYRFAARFTEPFILFDTPIQTSLFGSYQRFSDDNDEQYQVGATASFGLPYDIAASVGVSWQRDIDNEDEIVGLLSLSKAFGSEYAASASYSTEDNAVLAAATYQNQLGGVGTVNATVAAQSADNTDTALSATIGYVGNRFNLIASHSQEVIDNDATGELGSTTTVTASTALVFADGNFGISRPVGDSFAIIKPHQSLGDAEITLNPGIGEAGDQMHSDFLGPLVANSLGSYGQNTLRVKVEDLPLGYDLGQGIYDVAGPLNAGYVLELGSDRAASAIGTLLKVNGDPLDLATGYVTSEDDAGFSKQRIFTNVAGRFVVQGLVPGRTYVIEIDGVPETALFQTEPGKFGVNQIGIISTTAR